MYATGDYDLAGFAVGAAEREGLLTGAEVTPGDVILGLASSGLHSNGFSLVRKIVETGGLDYAAAAPFDPERTLGEALLAPTRIYVRSCLAAIAGGGVKALAHITGGGLIENIPRVLPHGVAARIDATRWTLPPVFAWLAETGGVARTEMARTFNCGIGMVAVVSAARADQLAQILMEHGETVTVIGDVIEVPGEEPHVVLENVEKAWQEKNSRS